MSKCLRLTALPAVIRESLKDLIGQSFQTYEDVGFLLEHHGLNSRPYSQGESMRDAKAIYRAIRFDHIRVSKGVELKTTISEVQILKGQKGQAGKTTRFYKLPVTLKDFIDRYPGYKLLSIVGAIRFDHDGDITLDSVYAKDKHLLEYLNKIFEVVKDSRPDRANKIIELFELKDCGSLVAQLVTN